MRTQGEATRHQIIEAAITHFATGGFEATSLREIGEALGITKAAVYYHFRSKDDLLAATVEPFLADAEALIAAGNDHGTNGGLLAAYLDVLLTHRRVVGFLAADLAALNRPVIAPRALTLRPRLRALLTGGNTDLAAQTRAECALGALDIAVSSLAAEDLASVREVMLASATAALEAGSRPAPVAQAAAPC